MLQEDDSLSLATSNKTDDLNKSSTHSKKGTLDTPKVTREHSPTVPKKKAKRERE